MSGRIAFAWLTQRGITRTSQMRAQLTELEEQAISGKKVNRASDAAHDWERIEQLSSRRRDQEQYSLNADRAVGGLDAMDRALADAGNILKRAWELTVGASSEVSRDDYMRAAASEIKGLRDSMFSIANRSFAGRALFAGTATDGDAFDNAGTYIGTHDEPAIRVGDADYVKGAVDGEEVFGGATDVFLLLDDAETAMLAGDGDAAAALLDRFEESHSHIAESRSKVGVDQRRAEDQNELVRELSLLLTDLEERATGTDLIETYTKLSAMRTSYEATLQITAQSFTPTLFQLMR